MKRNKIWIVVVAVVALAILYLIWGRGITQSEAEILVPVKKGQLDVTVTTTGELQALNSESIKGPFGLYQAGIYQVKISSLVPEGSIVKEGDRVAELDRSDVNSKIRDLEAEVQKMESQYRQTQLDTQLEMRNLRDELINQKFALEEKQLILEQSKYEPPATIRQAEIDLEKAKRTYEQSRRNYQLKLQQNRAKMQEVAASLNIQRNKLDQMRDLMQEFIILAPKNGMIIYHKTWSGRKVGIGSNISAYNPIVATLPDLSEMVSQTYVNEIDISKVRIGQPVEVKVDAFPDRKYQGKVTSVANIGEQLPNSQTKVFEVTIQLNGQDTLLRPAMTTSNVILTERLPASTLYIPVDALHDNDSLTFVYKANGRRTVKQEVLAGALSAEFAEIKAGLQENEQVYLTMPADTAGLEWQFLPSGEKTKPAAPTVQPVKDSGHTGGRPEAATGLKGGYKQ